MSTHRLRPSRRIGRLLVALAALAAGAYLVVRLGVSAAEPGAVGPGTTRGLFQPEALWGGFIAILFLAIAYGAWRYHRRNRANDAISEAATREAYDHPDRYPSEREDFETRLRP